MVIYLPRRGPDAKGGPRRQYNDANGLRSDDVMVPVPVEGRPDDRRDEEAAGAVGHDRRRKQPWHPLAPGLWGVSGFFTLWSNLAPRSTPRSGHNRLKILLSARAV